MADGDSYDEIAREAIKRALQRADMTPTGLYRALLNDPLVPGLGRSTVGEWLDSTRIPAHGLIAAAKVLTNGSVDDLLALVTGQPTPAHEEIARVEARVETLAADVADMKARDERTQQQLAEILRLIREGAGDDD